MTTTPTVWGNEVPFSNFFTDFRPQVIGATRRHLQHRLGTGGGNLVGRHFNELGSFTGGDFLSVLSASTTTGDEPSAGLPADRRARGRRLYAGVRAHDLDDSLALSERGQPRWLLLPIGEYSPDEVLLDSTALPGGGSANAFLFEDAGGVSNLCLRFMSANGIPVSDRIIFARESVGQTQQNPAVEGLQNGAAAVAYELVNTATFAREVRVQVRTADGGFATGVLQASAGGRAFPDIVALENNTFVVAWQQNNGIAFRQLPTLESRWTLRRS